MLDGTLHRGLREDPGSWIHIYFYLEWKICVVYINFFHTTFPPTKIGLSSIFRVGLHWWPMTNIKSNNGWVCQKMDEKVTLKWHRTLYVKKWILFCGHPSFAIENPNKLPCWKIRVIMSKPEAFIGNLHRNDVWEKVGWNIFKRHNFFFWNLHKASQYIHKQFTYNIQYFYYATLLSFVLKIA